MVDSPHSPIESHWNIDHVLSEYPSLLDTLADSHPALEKLRNPLVRRGQSRSVTVEQAADLAGLDPRVLVARLNKAAGFDVDPVPIDISPKSPEPDWVQHAQISERLDVRPLIARGEEPSGMILGAANRIPVGKVLSLRSPFDPVRLKETLLLQGFEAHSHSSGSDWTTLFLRVREAK